MIAPATTSATAAQASQHPPAAPVVAAALARSIRPRRPMSVSAWADDNMVLSSKGSSITGRWQTDRNPPLREPMDALSARSPVRDVVLMFPIQFGKSAVATNMLGYVMDHAPGPVMVALPGEVAMNKWINQKLNPLVDECAAVQRALTSLATRDSSNQRAFKDFAGGQLYLEHAGSPQRLKSTTVKYLLVDEIDEFPQQLTGGDDPVKMLNGRTSAYPSSYKRLYISTPTLEGLSRIKRLYMASDQRRYHVPCPDCGHLQPLEWGGLQWSPDAKHAWYVCRHCGVCIEEHHKTDMIANGRWVAQNPESPVRGYTLNGLYYQFGLGPRWSALAREWLDAQHDPPALKTFVNDRLAETWEDPAMRSVKHNVIADRIEPYALRTAPGGVLAITAGVDTQDNRLAVQIVGWGKGLESWVLYYDELLGDPLEDDVWIALADLLNRPIQHACGSMMSVEATAIDTGGHRGEAVKNFVRRRMIRRPMAIFGAVSNTAPVLGKGKLVDVTFRGKTDRRGVGLHAVGTVGIKHTLYARLSGDHDRAVEDRMVHFSDQLDADYFRGLVSETYNPAKNRFDPVRGGGRNEVLDTYVYAYAAAHHQELRLHRATKADWEARETRILGGGASRETSVSPARAPSQRVRDDAQEQQQSASATPAAPADDAFGSSAWSSRL